MTKVFIDGSAGTTGLRIHERLSRREDLEILTLSDARRKDVQARREMLNCAGIAFLCLPDAAAIEAAELLDNPETVLIDTSTAHRTNENWVYGLSELHGQKAKLEEASRIANPGCHATGFLVLAAPLVEEGAIDADALLSCFSLTGYSGGGKSMIAQYEDEGRDALLDAPRQYGLTQTHKHLPEMTKYAHLTYAPIFSPIVAPYYAGMEVTVPIHRSMLKVDPEKLPELYKDYYKSGLVHFCGAADEGGFLSAGAYEGRDDLEIAVFGQKDRILLVSRFDNLGKGASGAAIQNMNIRMGLPEAYGLTVQL